MSLGDKIWVMNENLIKLEIRSHPRFLNLVRQVAFELARLSGFNIEQAKEVRLALDEACTNVITHSYHGDYTRPIIINFYLHHDRLEALIQDFGLVVEPARIKSRPLEDFKPGGLGVYIMKKMMDEVEYKPTEEGPCLKLIKYKDRRVKSHGY